MNEKKEFLFYTDDYKDWELTLAAVRNESGTSACLIRRMIAFATEYGLDGNLWQHWLTYILMMHENPFSLACERRYIRQDATMMKLAGSDLEQFMDLFRLDFAEDGSCGNLPECMTDYQAPYDDALRTGPGSNIMNLSRRLAAAEDIRTFGRIIISQYEQYGVGMYSLYRAFRVAEGTEELCLVPVTEDTDVTFDVLIGCEEQKKTLIDNTEAFVTGAHANNVLLYGDSGTGKSTSVHALMHEFYPRGMRLVEISKQNRRLLPQVLSVIKKRNYKFIIFLDDLSFEENESDYKELKAMLEGALETRSDSVLIYATSNRRHLIRETWKDRSDMEYQEDVHHSDTMEEKLSLASRFGVTIYYSKPAPKEYLNIVQKLAERNGIEMDEQTLNDIARKWELRHGGMSGRTASQLITWLQGEAARRQQV